MKKKLYDKCKTKLLIEYMNINNVEPFKISIICKQPYFKHLILSFLRKLAKILLILSENL